MTTLSRLRRQRVFPGARIDAVCVSRDIRHVIIGIGQMHPVQQGRFGWMKARMIGSVQAWIYRACDKLSTLEHVDTFGQEGFSAAAGLRRARIVDELLREVAREVRSAGAEQFLAKTASHWRTALRRGKTADVAMESTKLSGLVVLQSLNPRVAVFPIEDERIHGAIGDTIRQLHREIDHLESSDAFRSARAKDGKNLSQAEYDAAVRFAALIKAYNKALASPQRDRAIFQAVLDQAQHQRKLTGSASAIVATFILGQAHRAGFLRLAKRHVPADTLCMWVTPSPLLFFIRLRQAVLWIAGVILAGLLFWAFF